MRETEINVRGKISSFTEVSSLSCEDIFEGYTVPILLERTYADEVYFLLDLTFCGKKATVDEQVC